MQSGLIICLCSVHICQHVCVIYSGNIVDYMHCIMHVNNIIIFIISKILKNLSALRES